jgi:hypothetical protein
VIPARTGARGPRTVRWVLVGAFLLGLAMPAAAQINMPDPSMIAGRALPAPELPDGTVSVRVVRESLGNDIAGQIVSVTADGTTKTGITDESGRAQVTGLSAGGQGTAETTVDGENMISLPFDVPENGGIRIILISGMEAAAQRKAKEEAAAAAAPAIQGSVIIGGDSRVIVEFADDSLRVFYILSIVNTARMRVDVGGPLIIDLPTEALSATALDGSSPTAAVRGNRIIITGPFAAGTTHVEVAFGLPHDSSTLTLTQTWPVALGQVLVMAQKVGKLQMTSPQFTEYDEATAGNGMPYLLGGGVGLPAGETLTILLDGLPVHAKWPYQTALVLAAMIMLIGAWFASVSGITGVVSQKRLTDQRESMLGELVKLDEQRRSGRVDGSRYASRRRRLMGELERVYGELDGMVVGRTGGGESAA